MTHKLHLKRLSLHNSRATRRLVHGLGRVDRSRASVAVCAGLGEFFKGFFDGSWAPKSTRIWRTQSFEHPASSDETVPDSTTGSASSSSSFNSSSISRPSGNSNVSGLDIFDNDNDKPDNHYTQAKDASNFPSSSSSSSSSNGTDAAAESASTGAGSGSFSDAEDGDLAAALNRRIGQIAASTAQYDSEMTEEEMRRPLTALELRQLIYAKYGKTYDVSFVRRDIPGKTFVCLNIMWNHLEQRSFKLTEQQYMEKLEGVSYLVGALGQANVVRAFLRGRARSQKGLPPRPVVGTAVSIRFDLEPAVIEEWFGSGYQ